MRKFFLGVLLALLVLNPFVVFAANNPMQNLAGMNIKDQPVNYQMLIDYDGRTDGQPVYVGYAHFAKGVSEDAWVIYNFQYDGSNQLTSRKTAYGVWDDRGSLTYQ